MAPTTSTITSPGSPAGIRDDTNPATTAAFSPAQSISAYQRRNILVHQNTPLLIATPPQVTRALAFSHPFLLPLNKFFGLLSWSSGDPWESFLLVAGFWALVLFGDDVIQWTGPLLAVAGLMAGMYGRRYSPLSTRSTDEKLHGHARTGSEGGVRHQKSLDEIVETLNLFTARCNIMLNPLLELTDFLSTQQTATSASTRPALTTLFVRLFMTLPLWLALTFPPLRILTTRRVVLFVGTIFLTWHSRPARISRTILWRSLSVRYLVSLLTGLEFSSPPGQISVAASLLQRRASQQALASNMAADKKGRGKGSVRFTFTLYENQRRWLGIGWTSSMFAYERAAWTDEHLNPAPPKERFQLPSVEGGARWRWVPNSDWRVQHSPAKDGDKSKGSSGGWLYYDNKWHDPRRQDGWNRYTRRRKWYRDAELVDAEPIRTAVDSPQSLIRNRSDTADTADSGPSAAEPVDSASPTELPASEPISAPFSPGFSSLAPVDTNTSADGLADDAASIHSVASATGTMATTATSTRRRRLFRRGRSRDGRHAAGLVDKAPIDKMPGIETIRGETVRSDDELEPRRSVEGERDWLVGDDLRMGLG